MSKAVGGFLDLAKLVSAGGASKKVVHEELAYKLGKCVLLSQGIEAVSIQAISKVLPTCPPLPFPPPCPQNIAHILLGRAGQDVYADFGGWHLYLRDMKGTGELKMSQVLASALGSKVGAMIAHSRASRTQISFSGHKPLGLQKDLIGGNQQHCIMGWRLPANGTQMSAKGFDDFEVEKLLKSIPVSLGGGKKTVRGKVPRSGCSCCGASAVTMPAHTINLARYLVGHNAVSAFRVPKFMFTCFAGIVARRVAQLLHARPSEDLL
jgi:hypothetical protein